METSNEHAPHLDLFSGIGGFSLAAKWAGFTTVAFAETDAEAPLMLREYWPDAPNLGDVRLINCRRFLRAYGRPGLLTGGVPCQPASLLGKRMGSADARWLWPATIGLVRELRPRYCVFENPPAILSLESGRAFSGILGGLAALGYDVLWGVIPAACVGAGHLRERLCIVAADSESGQAHERGRGDLGEAQRGWQGVHKAALVACEDVLSKTAADSTHDGERAGQCIESAAGFFDGANGDGPNALDATANYSSGHEPQHAESSLSCDCEASADALGVGKRSPHNNGSAKPSGREARQAFAGADSRDLRGRVFATAEGDPPWWHEAHTGIPVLAHGISSQLAEAAARCTGNAIVPEAFYPILRALRLAIYP